MKLKPEILITAGLLMLSISVSGQITKSLYVQSPCSATLITPDKKEITANDIVIVPNPNDGFFRIGFNPAVSFSEIKVTVINSLGQNVVDKTFELTGNYAEVDVRGTSRGIYMVRIITGKEVILKKIIISF